MVASFQQRKKTWQKLELHALLPIIQKTAFKYGLDPSDNCIGVLYDADNPNHQGDQPHCFSPTSEFCSVICPEELPEIFNLCEVVRQKRIEALGPQIKTRRPKITKEAIEELREKIVVKKPTRPRVGFKLNSYKEIIYDLINKTAYTRLEVETELVKRKKIPKKVACAMFARTVTEWVIKYSWQIHSDPITGILFFEKDYLLEDTFNGGN